MPKPLLLTPGPLTTDLRTRQAMLDDWGSRDPAFVEIVARVRREVLRIAGASSETHSCVPMQGSGTFAIESLVGSLLPRDGKLLVAINGAYGRRIHTIAETLDREVTALRWSEDEPVDPSAIDQALADDPSITHVAVIHCETTTGLLNPVEAVADVVAARGRGLFVDAMSAFGALPLDASHPAIVAVAASSNKCLEGLPGLGLVIARKDALEHAAGNAHSLSLDLAAQWERLERDGQFRFTPPTSIIAALDRAIALHTEEGGVSGRGRRYTENCRLLVRGMRQLGFETYLPAELQAPIIVTFRSPDGPSWDFGAFFESLQSRGFSIYPGKLTEIDTFRVGCIGQVFPEDIERFLGAVSHYQNAESTAVPTPVGSASAREAR